ncbi:MAG: Stp1/IreP family PP2C-type Ser/Thr phosphatase [Firmicutes bacterium]|nr:Stp1/IreP family PP2C-type Ser/Thr phosphatase [Bacillota bacterium]
MQAAALTDVGMVREQNEDAFYLGENVFAVADGMGGHYAGEVASGIAIRMLRETNPNGSSNPENPESWLRSLISDINAEIFRQASIHPGYIGMGTTLTVLLMGDNWAYIGHVGDSRAYLLRDGMIRQLTDDHSVVGELLRRGVLTREEARFHPQRNIITRALGTFPHIDIDILSLDTRPGDRLLLCTDGLTGAISDEELADILLAAHDPEQACKALIEAANEGGGHDNTTVVVVYCS